MPSLLEQLKNGPARWLRPFGIVVKGREQNRVPLPSSGGYGGYGDVSGWESELLAAVRGINLPKNGGIDFRREAGDFRSNSIVALCQNWIGTSFPQAPPRLGNLKDGKIEPVKGQENHPALKLLRRPNPAYAGKWLAWSLTSDWFPAGNAYAHLVTDGRDNQTGTVVEIEWLPASCVVPKPKSDGRLDYYEYTAGGQRRELSPREVAHFRFGVDALNPLAGLSPLLAQDRFIVADNSGAAYSAGLLLHGGIPPALLVAESPSGGNMPGLGAGRTLTPDEAETLTERLAEKFKSEPGKVRFLSNAVKLLMLGYKPQEMALNELMEEPETRIPAAYGIPPEVLKLRVGLLHSTENNIEQSRKAAWQDCLIPCQDHFADTWTSALLSRFTDDESLVVYYDRSEIGVLQPDFSALRNDAATLFTAGILDRAQAKTLAGFTPEDADKGVYGGGMASPSEEPLPTQKKTVVIPAK